MRASGAGRLTDGLVVVGIACSIGLIILSAVINFRLGYRSADTEFDGWIYGLGLGLADVVKALTPFFIAWAWRHKDRLAFYAGAALFVMITANSLNGAIRFAAEHQSVRQSERLGDADRRSALLTEIAAREAQEKRLGVPRSIGEVESAIAAALARPVDGGTVASVSSSCSLNRRATRKACAKVAERRAELEIARSWTENRSELSKARHALAALEGKGSNVEDPQLDAVEGIIGWWTKTVDGRNVSLALLLLFGVVFELGSGLGLYVVTTPWRTTTDPPKKGEPVVQPELGLVDRYAADRIDREDGRSMTLTELLADYRDWCRRSRCVPLNQVEFARNFEALAAEIGIVLKRSASGPVFEDVGFISAASAAQVPAASGIE